MPWKHANQLRINGGPGFPVDFFRKAGEPTVRQVALQEIERKLKKLNLPKSYARPLLQLDLKTKRLREVLARLVELIQEREAAKGHLTQIRTQIQQLLTQGEEPNVPQTLPDLRRVDQP